MVGEKINTHWNSENVSTFHYFSFFFGGYAGILHDLERQECLPTAHRSCRSVAAQGKWTWWVQSLKEIGVLANHAPGSDAPVRSPRWFFQELCNSVRTCIYILYIYTHIYYFCSRSIYRSIDLSINWPLSLSISLSFYVSIFISISIYLYLSQSVLIYLYIYLYPSIYLSVSLCVYIYIYIYSHKKESDIYIYSCCISLLSLSLPLSLSPSMSISM